MKAFLVNLLNTNVISILVAMVTGVVINLFTAESGPSPYYLAIGCFLASTIFLMYLLVVREDIEDKFRSVGNVKRMTTEGDSNETEIKALAELAKKTKSERLSWTISEYTNTSGRFFLLTFISLGLVSGGIGAAIYANAKKPKPDEKLDRILERLEKTPICVGDKAPQEPH